MINAETLRKYLPCHATYGDFDLCIECPYNPNPGKIWQYGCAHGQDKMIDDAIKLLKEKEGSETEMKHAQFAQMKHENGNVMFLNIEYITAYGYAKEQDETVVAMLYEGEPLYFPGDQTREIRNSLDV